MLEGVVSRNTSASKNLKKEISLKSSSAVLWKLCWLAYKDFAMGGLV